MNFGIEKFKNSYMNFAGMKYHLKHSSNKQTNNNTKEEESIKSTINSFRQCVPQSNKSSIKYMTSKNSPERPSDRSTVVNAVMNNPIKINSNRYIISKSQSKEKYFEAILKKKMLQLKEKDKEQHHNSNYMMKVKNKITLETTSQIKMPYQPLPVFHSKSNSHLNVVKKTTTTTPKLKAYYDLNSHRIVKGIGIGVSKTALSSKQNSRKPSIDYKANGNDKLVQIQMQVQKQLRQKSESHILNNSINQHKQKEMKQKDIKHFKGTSSEYRRDNYNIWKVLKESLINNNHNNSHNHVHNHINSNDNLMNNCHNGDASRSSRKKSNKSKEILVIKTSRHPSTTCNSPKNTTILQKQINIQSSNFNNKGKSNLKLDMNKFQYNHAIATNKEPLINTITSNHPFLQKINESNSVSISIESCIKEPSYFKHEKEVLIKYIIQYYKEKSCYPKTNPSFYLYGRVLGKGNFGKVNLALNILTGRLVAIKTINKNKQTSETAQHNIQLETAIMKRCRHSSIAQIYETFESNKYIFIVMEYLSAGDLLKYIRKRSKLSESIARIIFKQIIEALSFIHSMRVVHRDIKLDNILIDLDNNIKLCDFGVSRKIGKDDIMMEQCGTPAYIAPEILGSKGYQGFTVDVWSAGVSLYVMLTGTVPFKGSKLDDLYDLIRNGSMKAIEVEGISQDAKHLIGRLLEIDCKKRITVPQILAHPWLVNVDSSSKGRVNLFTNAERILLSKSNIDYLSASKEDLIEQFTIKNLDSMIEATNQNINSKSHILAPFNSSMSIIEDEEVFATKNDAVYDYIRKSLPIKNNVMKFTAKVKEINRNYELNNNGEIDNGVVIQPQEDSNKSELKIDSYNKIISPVNERCDVNGKKMEKVKMKVKEVICSKVLEKVEMLGFDKEYVRLCLENNEINHATTCYYLLLKYND